MTWPFENDTTAIINKLAKRNMQSEKRRNLMVIIAVALSAFLICLAGTIVTSMLQMQQKQVNDTYEATFVGVTEQNIETLKAIPEIARVGEYYMLGTENDAQGFTASFAYADAALIYTARNQIKLTEGELPENENEIVISEVWLSKYAPDIEIGSTIRLDTESFQGDYIVSGIIDAPGAENAAIYSFLVSKAALIKWSGYSDSMYVAYCHLENDRQLDEDTIRSSYKQIAEENNLPEPRFSTLYFRYAESNNFFRSLPLMFTVAAIVLIGGCIVIQSIFRISINDKIQSYGQLRTIGATAKQIKRFVKKEGHRLGGIGILVGIVLSVICSLIIFFDGFNALYYAGIVLLTILICWIMVSLSIRKPIKIAAGISPVEAVRFSPEQVKTSHSKKSHAKLNPLSLGLMNARRDKKKTLSIISSLSLGGILLLIISSIALTQSPERIARQYFPDGDYKIYNNADSLNSSLLAGNPLNEEVKQQILSIDGVTDVIITRQSAFAEFSTEQYSARGMCDMLTTLNYADVEDSLTAGTMPSDSHSILLADSILETNDDMGVGTVLEFSFGEAATAVKVVGLFSPTNCKAGIGHGLGLDGAMVFAPESLFQELLPEIENFSYSWSIVSDSGQSQSVEEGLQNIVSIHSDLAINSFADTVENDTNSKFYMAMKIVSWLIFLFGVVNLINTTLANQLSRKRENSILRSIGLTQKQLYKMIVCEEIYYALFAITATLIIGLPVAIFSCREISKISYAGEIIAYQFPLFEMGLFLLVLFGLEFILSLWTIRRQKKQSLIEQMRTME